MVRVLVTGATGAVGPHLAALLLERKHQVFAMARSAPKAADLPAGVEFIAGDVMRIDGLYKIMEKVDVVIHMAAAFDFYPSNPAEIYSTNVEGTRNAITAAAKRGVRRFIYISSTEAMGGSPNATPRDEQGEMLPNFDYGISKQLAEESVRDIAESEGIEYVILRPCGISDDNELDFQLIWAANMGLFFFTPEGKRPGTVSFISVKDAVAGIALAVEKKEAKNQTYILAAPAIKYSDAIALFNQQCGRAAPMFSLPLKLVIVIVAILAPILRLRFKKRFTFETHTLEMMELYRSYDASKAQRELGWAVPDMKVSYERHVQDLFLRGKLTRYPISPVVIILVVLLILILIIFFVFLR